MLWVDKYRPNSLEKVIYTLIEYEIWLGYFLFVGVNYLFLVFDAIAPKLSELSVNSISLMFTHVPSMLESCCWCFVVIFFL